MLVYIGLAVVSIMLAASAGTWAYVFFIILREGEILISEPNRPILMAEFGMAVVYTLASIFFLVVAILGLTNKLIDRWRRKSEGGKR